MDLKKARGNYPEFLYTRVNQCTNQSYMFQFVYDISDSLEDSFYVTKTLLNKGICVWTIYSGEACDPYSAF